jgi:SagB-type dehydrogenase family enzyme
VRLRRARTILAYWSEGQLVFENYRTRTSIVADPIVARVLHLLDRWQHIGQLLPKMPEYSPRSLRLAVKQLREHTLVVKEGSRDAEQDSRLARVWSSWLPYGGFHFATKDVAFVWGKRRERMMETYLAESRQPAFHKRYREAPRLSLPRFPQPSGEFLRVLLGRRTQREFSAGELPLSAVSQLLFYSWGVMGYLTTPFGRLAHKTSPSGGARHPCEVYLVALKVKGLPSGLYHYDPRNHCLEGLRKGRMENKAIAYCAGRANVKYAAALFLMTAVFPRTIWKYRFARAYRVVTLDAGHLCQTFCLTATFLGLAPFCTAALKDSLIEKDLGLDGISESVVYAAGVGLPRARSQTRGTE